ncbi:MAG: hypothetical protein E4H43_02725 [Bacteroidia bacterium]|nr:MAG: hypothetical protein E4H43_02725 [Bacteroidia bacterium]
MDIFSPYIFGLDFKKFAFNNIHMRTYFSVLFIFIFGIAFPQESPDGLEKRLKTDANVSLNSNGMASIPAFSLGKPAIIASVSLTKNRFSYDPVLAYGVNMKPWFIDNWLHYKIIRKPFFELRTGVNFSTFFTDYKLTEETILRGDRYLAFELAATYKFPSNTSLTFMYWNDNGLEPGTISGHVLDLAGEKTGMKIGKSILMSANIQLFIITYDGNNDGLFVSPKISFALRNVPIALFWQGTQVIESNIIPDPGFQWNIGLSYSL